MCVCNVYLRIFFKFKKIQKYEKQLTIKRNKSHVPMFTLEILGFSESTDGSTIKFQKNSNVQPLIKNFRL